MGTGHQHPPRGLDPGYARVSSTEQSLERRLDAPATAGISTDRVYRDRHTGRISTETGIPKTSKPPRDIRQKGIQ